jgi:selenocysteine lyase/cysteine desulfurase
MLDCRAEDFFLPQGHHYLNCAYMAPMSRAVEEAGIAGIRAKRTPAAITPADFFATSTSLRETFARLVGVSDPNRIAIVAAASYGLAVAAKNLPFSRGQHVLALTEQFPSNVYTWQRLATESGGSLIHVEPGDGPGRGPRWNDRILEAIGRDTAIVALPQVHWADGTLFDLERIGARCRDVGASLVVDGTQSVGAMSFDVESVQPDVLVCAGYKWLLGPYSIGLAYFGPRLDQGTPLEENWISRRNSDDFAGLVRYRDEYGPSATRYDVGERSNFILAPMLLAALGLLESWGIDNIQAYCETIATPIVEAAQELGYRVEDAADRGAHLFGLRMPEGTNTESLRAELAGRDVSVSIRGDAIRVAPNVYNDMTNVDALVAGLTAHARTRSAVSI